MSFFNTIKISNRETKKRKNIFLPFAILIALFFSVGGCGSQKTSPSTPPPPPPAKVEDFTPPPKMEIPRYSYAGDRYPDPFVPLSASARSSAPDELVIPNINSLSLKGIYTAGKEKIALLAGGGYSYTSRNGYLYDARNRMIPGYRCVIGVESVRVSAGGVSRELKIRE